MRRVIEDLDFISDEGDLTSIQGRTKGHAAVAAGRQFEIKSQNEIGIFFLREQIATAIGRANQHAVLHQITRPFLPQERPTFQRLAIEQRSKSAFSRIVWRSGTSGEERQTSGQGERQKGKFFHVLE